MKASHLLSVLVALLLPWLAWAQPSYGVPAPAPAPAPPSAPALEAMQLAEQGCQSDGYEADLCNRAISQLEAAVRENPEQTDVQLALAQACWNRSFQERSESSSRKNWQKRSTDIYEGLVDRNVGDARPYYELSVRRKDEGRRVGLLRRTVELNPRHPRANQDLAWGLLKEGKADEAARVYQRHLTANLVKDRQEVKEDLRFAGAMARAQRPQEAAQVLEKVMEQTKGERRSERCVMLQAADPQLAEARPAVKRMLQELRPYCTATEHLDRAVELEQQGRVDEAVQELERQVQTNPKPEETHVMLERLYLRKGMPEKAAEATTRYLRAEPEKKEKCERFLKLSPRTLRSMGGPLVEAARKECEKP